jgi:hypothetical protein
LIFVREERDGRTEKMKGLIIVLIIVLGACGDDRLTRTRAERVLMNDKDFAGRTELVCLGTNCPTLETEEALATLDYITMRRRGRFNAEIALTEKGRTTLENLKILPRTRYASFSIGRSKVVEITGIFHKGGGVAEVEFTWAWEPNAVGAELLKLRKGYIRVGPHKLKKILKHYDDGWRVDWEQKS